MLVVVISVTKEGVKFSTRGDIGTANIVCRQNTTVDKVMFICPLFLLHHLKYRLEFVSILVQHLTHLSDYGQCSRKKLRL